MGCGSLDDVRRNVRPAHAKEADRNTHTAGREVQVRVQARHNKTNCMNNCTLYLKTDCMHVYWCELRRKPDCIVDYRLHWPARSRGIPPPPGASTALAMHGDLCTRACCSVSDMGIARQPDFGGGDPPLHSVGCSHRQKTVVFTRTFAHLLTGEGRGGGVPPPPPHRLPSMGIGIQYFFEETRVLRTPPPLYKLRPCPSYSGCRDRINLVPNLIRYKCSAAT